MSLSGKKLAKGPILWIAAFCIGVGVAWVMGGFREVTQSGFSVTAGTNVARVSVEVTHGMNHVFYYRGKARWKWNAVCRRFGLRLLVDCERQVSRTYEPADMLWVRCQHRGEPLDPRLFKMLEVTAQGVRRTGNTTGGVRDHKRGVTVSHWPMTGGMEKHRGSVIYVKYGGRELAKIEVR